MTPKERVAAAVHRWGPDEVLAMTLGVVARSGWLAEGKPPGLVNDPGKSVAIAADVALDRLWHRLDRPVRADFR